MRPITHIRRALPLAVLALLAGCDTNNSGGIVDDLAGTYAFTELRFVPTASAIEPANVLSRLDTALTDIEIDSEGRAFFFLRESGTTLIAEAFVTATSSTATFRARTATDIERLVRYLLPSVLRVSHDGGVNTLDGSPSLRVNLQAFDPQAYQGLTDVPGTLYVRMERR